MARLRSSWAITAVAAMAQCTLAIAPTSAALAASGRTGTTSTAGAIQAGTVSFTIAQAPLAVPDCTQLALTPAGGWLPAAGGAVSASVTTDPRWGWIPVSDASWLSIADPARLRMGPGSFQCSAEANAAASPRTAAITVGPRTFLVTQNGAAAAVDLKAVCNAASYAQGAVSPGEIVVLFGAGLGPAQIATAEPAPGGGAVTTLLGGTRVLFDGAASPMVYALTGQVSAVAPYGVAGRSTTQIQVEYQGNRSAPLTVSVIDAVAGIFTLDQSGSGQGAILNQNYSVNGPDNPAPRGSVVMVFSTGGGQTDPAGADGGIAAGAAPLRLPVTARIGAVDVPVPYAGAAPGLVNGAVQVNVEIPSDAPSGSAVPLTLRFGDYGSQARVTLAIRE